MKNTLLTNKFNNYYKPMDNKSSIIDCVLDNKEFLQKKFHYKKINSINYFNNKKFIINKKNQEILKFNQIYKIINPIVTTIFSNTKYKTLNKYKIKISKNNNFKSETRNLKYKFIPAGTCFYGSHIFLNNNLINNKHKFNYGLSYVNNLVIHILLHELGHAVDYPYEESLLLINQPICQPYNFISSNYNFKKLTKKNYKNTRPLTRVKKYKQYIGYYTKPAINTNIEKTHLIYNWHRACSESFAESFAFISNWLLNGFNELITYAIYNNKKSFLYNNIKILMPTLLYLLDNLNWKYIGIPAKLILKRKKNIKFLLLNIKNNKNKLNSFKNEKQIYPKKIDIRKIINF